uniref:Odorant receptor n=1 Tax=Trichogramma kaykai TaxID=54128 RepID=A0ABD2VTU4_9HYME
MKIASSQHIDAEETSRGAGLPIKLINKFLDEHFYGFKKYMEVAGFWQGQSTCVKSLMKMWFLIVFTFSAGSEFVGFYRSYRKNERMSLEAVTDSIFETSTVLIIVSLYLLYQPKLKKFKSFLDFAVADCRRMLRSEEADVFMEFANFYYKLAMLYLGMFMVMIPSAIIFPVTMPLLLNYVVPGNTSFEPIIITQAYVGFEPREHILPFLFLLLNFGAAMALCLNACSSSLLFAVIFLVVKFKVIGCRLDKLYKRLNDDRVVQFSVEYNQDLLYRHIKELIKDHASCYEVLGQIAALSGNVLFVALGNAIFDLIISGTMIVYQFDNNPDHCLKMGTAACCSLMSGFALCFIGQLVTDASDEIFDKA